jgi:hypothetical protein
MVDARNVCEDNHRALAIRITIIEGVALHTLCIAINAVPLADLTGVSSSDG